MRVNFRKLLSRAVRFSVRALITFLFVFVSAVVVISLPPVQNIMVPYVRNQLSSMLGAQVELAYVNIALPDKVLLGGLKLYDKKDVLLLGVERLKVGIIHLNTLEWIKQDVKLRNIGARIIELEEPVVNLYRSREDCKMNFEFLIPQQPDTAKPSGAKVHIDLPIIEIENLQFRYVDSTLNAKELRTQRGRVNYANLWVDSMSVEASFKMNGPGRFKAWLEDLHFDEKYSGLHLRHLSTKYETNMDSPFDKTGLQTNPDSIPYISLRETHVELDGTFLDFDMEARNERFETFFQNNAPKKYLFRFDRSAFQFESVNYFLPQPLELTGVVGLEGKITGTPTKLRTRGFKAWMGRETQVNTDAYLTNFTNGDSLFLELKMQNTTVQPTELARLLPRVQFPKELFNAGLITLDARYTGFTKDFVANGNFETKWGKVRSDVNIKIDKKGVVSYEGDLRTTDLNVDTIIRAVRVTDKLNFEGKVKGKDLVFDKMEARFDFKLGPSNLMAERIDSVRGDVTLDKKLIAGNLTVQDKEGYFNGKVTADFREAKPNYFAFGNLRNLDLLHYGIIQDSVRLNSTFNIKMSGDSLDNLGGYIRFISLRMHNERKDQELGINNILISSKLNTLNNKQLKIESDVVDFGMQGKFSYQQAADLIKELGKEVQLYLRNDTAAIRSYYETKKEADYLVTFGAQLTIKRLNPWLLFFDTGLQVEPGTEMLARAILGKQNRLTLRFNSKYIQKDSLRFNDVRLSLQMQKDANQNDLAGEGKLTLSNMALSRNFSVQQVAFTQSLERNSLYFKLGMTQDSARNKLKLAGNSDFRNGLLYAHLDADSSSLSVRDSTWRFDPDNKIVYAANYLVIENFRLFNREQSIFIESDIRPRADSSGYISDEVHATIRSLQLRSVNELTGSKQRVEGKLNADVFIKNLFSQPLYRVNSSVTRFRYQDVRYGDVFVRTNFSDLSQKLQLNVSLISQGDTLLGLAGTYNLKDLSNPMDFELSTYNLPFNLLQPFVGDVLYDLRGNVALERLRVTGRLSAPVAEGRGEFRNVGFGVNYFKTKYAFSGPVVFNKDNIHLPQLLLQDARGNRARLAGYVRHKGFSNFLLELDITDVRNFLVMDTKKEDNELFYGRAVVRRGFGQVRGPLDKMNIYFSASTGNGTQMNIPVSFYRQQQRLPYVYFRNNPQDTTIYKPVQVGGMGITLEVEATPEAEMNIVFDEKTNEIIRGRGTGIITLSLSPSGDFSMYGTYEITRGIYPLKIKGLVDKRFEVEPGGTIYWNGDPLDATMNLTATYRVQASLSSLLSAGPGGQSVRRPVDVLLKLKGSLLKPDISFDINLPNTGQDNSLEISSLMRTIQNDPSELNRQVVSLLAFRTFAPTNQGNDVAGQAAGNSAFELLSSQINNMLNQAGAQNVDINVSSTNSGRDVNLGISTRLFNDRLTIERNGAITNQQNQGISIGNLSARWRLLPTRRMEIARNPYSLDAEVFNRENIGLGSTRASTSQGLGLFYRKEADSISDLFRSNRKKETNVVAPIDTAKIKLPIKLDFTPKDTLKTATPVGAKR